MHQIFGFSPSLDSKFLSEWTALSREPDPELRAEGLLVHAGRLEKVGNAESAFAIYAHLAESSPFSAIQARAAKALDARIGRGSFGGRFEYLFERFVQEATSYKTILPMMLGTGVYQTARSFALGRLAESGVARAGSRLIAGGFGMLFEVPVFALGSRGLREAAGEVVDWSSPALEKDLLATTLTLSALKVSGFAGEKFLQRMPCSLAWAKGAVPPMAIFGGLLASHHLETGLGLRPKVDDATAVMDTLASMLSLGIGERIGHHVIKLPLRRWYTTQVAPLLRISSPRAPSWATLSLLTCLSGCSVAGDGGKAGAMGAVALGLGVLAMARSGRNSKVPIRPDTIEDPKLRELSDAIAAYQEVNSQHPMISVHTRELAERLKEMGDIRGEWMQAQLSLNKNAYEIHDRIQAEIREKFGIGAGYHLEMGGKSLVLTIADGPELTAASLSEFLRAGYAFPLTRLWIMESSFGDKRISGPLRVNESLGKVGLNKYGKYLEKAGREGRVLRFLRDMGFIVGGHRSIAEVVEALAGSPALAKLGWLDLSENLVGDAGLAAIAKSRNFGELRILELGNSGVGDAGIQALAESQSLGHLRELHLLQNNVGDAGARALANSRSLSNLQELELYDNRIGVVGARAIAASTAFQNLKLLTLGENAFGREGVLTILDSKNLQNLRGLDLSDNGFSYSDLKKLISKENFPNLEVIDQLEKEFEFD